MAKTGEASFEIYKDVAGEFRFRLRAPNGKIVAVGEGYDTKASCVDGVNALKEYSIATVKDLTIGETTLILDEPPRNVKKQSTIAFSGRLIGAITGEGIPEAKIDICDRDRPFTKDDHVASGKTRGDGTVLTDFKIVFYVEEMKAIFTHDLRDPDATPSLERTISYIHGTLTYRIYGDELALWKTL